ncbi:protein of unknown function [Methylotuvimicrobium alcaliphilum 20Z]|uniref:Uncharacterized protein n=1 Tax=Methylotuvimicrobium alcaliphilum (strain DSM 19304 / NCIMB 14124 / VKM B-2133 / 20Z) TaxID=1091494 RepID=G4T1I9_META2|nr:protein of unknown function [Methylotuvimicrobium alcaliphilum 20Z]
MFSMAFQQNGYRMSIDPVLATELRPMACVLVSVFLDALITVDFSTFEPTTLIEPVLAALLRPMACVLVNVFFDALIKVDFSILEPSAIALLLNTASKATAANIMFFMIVSSGYCNSFVEFNPPLNLSTVSRFQGRIAVTE